MYTYVSTWDKVHDCNETSNIKKYVKVNKKN